MNLAFAFQAVWALALVALLLLGMTYVARSIQRGRLVVGARTRLISTVESSILAQNVTVHVIKVAGAYYLVGGGSAGVNLLAELPADEVEPYIESQRAALAAQRASVMRAIGRFRKS